VLLIHGSLERSCGSAQSGTNQVLLCRGGGAIALQAPTEAELWDVTFSANEAIVSGGAILLEGKLGNNSLSLSGSNSFQGNRVNSTRQDIAVSSAASVTFDSDLSVASIVGESSGGFAWQPTVTSVRPNTSASDSYPAFLTRDDSWIVDAERVRILPYP
jgi:predicted outer membrane repeat protein